jgi:DinB superfamily
MGEWRALRALNLRFIASLSAAQLKRVGVHSERGEESIEHLIRMYAGHDVLHVRQIDRIMNATRAPGAGGIS